MFGGNALRRAWQFLGGGPSVGIFLATTAGALAYLAQLNMRYAVRDWLVWRLLPLWAWTLALNVGLVVSGAAVLRWLVPRAKVSVVERLTLSFGLGMALFALLMFGGGALGLFHGWFAVALLVFLAGLGFCEFRALWRQAAREAEVLRQWTLGQRTLFALALGFTALMLTLVYLQALTPNSFNFDAIWYHVPIAQDYARLGRIVPFFGDNHRAYPHLASLFHTFALLVPGLHPEPLRWMLMLHIEFSMVVWRMAGMVAIAIYLLGGRRVPGLAAVFFLFPSIFIYDQNIGGSADHLLGASAAPIFLALAYTLPRFHLRWALVTGILAGVHILSKYQAMYMVFAVAMAMFLRFTFFLVAELVARSKRGAASRLARLRVGSKKLWGAPIMILGAALLVSSPHFIKNAVFYQNPVYPFLSRVFPSSFDDWERPAEMEQEEEEERELTFADDDEFETEGVLGGDDEAGDELEADLEGARTSPDTTSDAGVPGKKKNGKARLAARAAPKKKRPPYDFIYRSRAFSFSPQGDSPLEKLVWVHKIFADWSFLPANRGLTSQKPYMGALFTLLLPVLLFLRGASRLWLGVGVSYLAFMAWGLSNANDRYLLAFLSVPMGVAAALLVRAFEAGKLARLGTVLLVLVQLVWGFDAPFEYGGQRLADAVSMVKSGYRSPADDTRFRHRWPERQITEKLPEDAVVLGRYFKSLLGINRTMLNTHADIQTYINFKQLSNVRDFWQVCHDRGITHLLYPEGQRQPTRAQDTILFDALVEATPDKKKISGNWLATLSDEPPEDTGPLWVYVKGVREYKDGIYPVQKLSRDSRAPRPKGTEPLAEFNGASVPELLTKASALYVSAKSMRGYDSELTSHEFRKVESFRGVEIWLK